MRHARALVVAAIVAVLCAVVAPTHAASPSLGGLSIVRCARQVSLATAPRPSPIDLRSGQDGLRPERLMCHCFRRRSRSSRSRSPALHVLGPRFRFHTEVRWRRHPDRACLERQPPPRGVRRPDPHPCGPEPARTTRRGHWYQADRRSRARRLTRTSTRDGTRSAGSRPTSGSSRGHCRRSPSAGSRSPV
jgi:hypothetical protein